MKGVKHLRIWLWIVLIPVVTLIALYIVLRQEPSVQLTVEERQWLDNHQTIRIAPNPNFAPIEFFEEDSLYSGFTFEIVQLIEQRLGIKFTVVRYGSQAEIFEAVKDLCADVITGTVTTPKREEYLLFTQPIVSLRKVIVVRKENRRMLTIDSLKGKLLAIVNNSSVHEALINRQADLQYDTVHSALECLYEVSFGRADAAVMNLASAVYHIGKGGLTNLRVAGDYSVEDPIVMAVRNDWPMLRGLLNKAIASISKEQHNRIAHRWLGLQIELPWWEFVPWQWIALVIVLIGGLAAAVLIWNRSLQHQVQIKTIELKQELIERRKIEEALRESEEKFRRIFDLSPVGAAMVGLDNMFIRCNEAFCHFLGYTEDELKGKTFLEVTYKKDKELGLPEIKALLAGKIERARVQKRYVRKDETIIWGEVTIRLMFASSGQPLYFLPIIQDITEQKQAEEALRKSEGELQSIFRASPIGIGVVINRIIVAVNDLLCTMTGYSREELLYQSARLLYPTDEEYEYVGREKYQQIKEKGTGTVETRWRKKNGNIIDVLLSSTPIDTGIESPRVTFTATDITERKLLARQLTESQKMESLGTLAGGIAHDFNNILNIILGYTDRLLNQPEIQEKQKHDLETIQKAAERATRLIRQILTFARRTPLEKGPIHINTLVDELAKMLYEMFPKTTEITADLEQYLSPILGDRNQIHQALLNLAINARDAMPSGGKLVFKTRLIQEAKVQSRFQNVARGNYVCISVKDTGIGIDEETIGRIFEPFFTTKDFNRGTGLGLSVVYGIVSGMKGFIDVKSEVGHGTTFFLYLPAATAEWRAMQKEITNNEIRGGTETILVIEDEEAARELLAETLEAKGYHIIEAADGEQALKVYRNQYSGIDLVLSDLGLPRMNGYDCYKQMKVINPKLRMILASGFFDPKERQQMEADGVRLFVQKPYHMERILIGIREVMDGVKK